MAEAHPNFVAGLVCRHKPTSLSPSLPSSLVLMVPGVRLTEGTDSLGQQYLTPEKVRSQLAGHYLAGAGPAGVVAAGPKFGAV